MTKMLMLAAAVGLCNCLLPVGAAAAQQQAPLGRPRQPTASEVPADDSVRGDANLLSQTPNPTPKKRSRSRRAQSNVNVIMKTPNICSNCNQ